MAFGDTVRTDDATGASGEVSFSFTAPTSGNLMIVVAGRSATHSAGGAWSDPSGWNRIHDSGINTGQLGAAAWWKISDGTETGFTTTDTNEQGSWQVSWAEFEGPFAASPLDQVQEDAANIGTVVTSQATGTTGTTAQADELAVACFVSDRQDTVDGSRSYNNSFTEVNFSDRATARPAAIIAKKVLTVTGTVTCTFSCTDTGDEMYGCIATFKKASSGLSGTIGQVTESDTAQAFSRSKILAAGQVTETDLAQAFSRSKILAAGQVTETDLAQAFSRSKILAAGQVTETDLAQAFSRSKILAAGQVEEIDLAQPFSRSKIRTIAQAEEIDLAQAVSNPAAPVIGQVEEIDLAQPFSRSKIRTIAQAEETDLAQAMTRVKVLQISQVSETDLAQALFPLKLLLIAQVLEVDTAQAFARVKIRTISQVSETDLALALIIGSILEIGADAAVKEFTSRAGVALAIAARIHAGALDESYSVNAPSVTQITVNAEESA